MDAGWVNSVVQAACVLLLRVEIGRDSRYVVVNMFCTEWKNQWVCGLCNVVVEAAGVWA